VIDEAKPTVLQEVGSESALTAPEERLTDRLPYRLLSGALNVQPGDELAHLASRWNIKHGVVRGEME